MIEGHLDRLTHNRVTGWAVDLAQGRGARVLLRVNGEDRTWVDPQVVRVDLAGRNIQGAAGFDVALEPPLADGMVVELLAEDGTHLVGSPRRYEAEIRLCLPEDPADMRRAVAQTFLQGQGLEIGALHNPLPVGPNVQVRYVDRLPLAGLEQEYEEIKSLYGKMVVPDIVDDGERLATVADASQDFVIANHFLEHTEDPIACLKNLTRVIKPGGRLYLAVPDMRDTFDHSRLPTSIDHCQADHQQGPRISRLDHYREFHATVIGPQTGQGRFASAEAMEAANYSIHFHVWTSEGFLEFFCHVVRSHQLPLRILCAFHNTGEIILVAERREASSI